MTSKEELRAKELADLDLYYEQLIIKATLAGNVEQETLLALEDQKRTALKEQQAEFDQEDQEEADKRAEEAEKAQQVKIDEAEKILESELDLEEKKRKFKADTLDNLIQLGGEESKLSKALLLAKQAIALDCIEDDPIFL